MTDRLLRESDPPAGMLASPVPQVWDPTANGGAGGYVRVYGEHNAPRAILYGPNGQPIGSSNPLPVADSALAQAVAQLATEGKLEEARALLETISQKDFATQTTLSEVLQRLEAIEEQLETGDAKVQLTGQKVEEVKTQADAVGGVVTFSSPITAVEILNLDSVNHGTFTVNGLAITVPRGSAYRSYIGGTPGTTVSVAGSTQYEIRRLV